MAIQVNQAVVGSGWGSSSPTGVKPTEESIIRGSLTTRSQILKRQAQPTFTYSAWDNSVYGPKIVVDPDGTYRMFYTGYEAAYASWCICVATSPDLATWTKPVLNLFTYGGNSNNNIVLLAGGNNLQFADITIDPVFGLYVMSVRNDTSGSNLIYTSSDGINFTFVTGALIDGTTGLANGGVAAHPNSNLEVKSLTWSPLHNKWRWWYAQGQSAGTDRRSVGYYDADVLGGPWTNRGVISPFISTSATIQYYDFSTFYYAGSLWAVVNMYDSSTLVLSPLRLYRSDDHGNTWVRSTDLLRRPGSGAWDYGLVSDGCPILVNGVWQFFYAGKTGLHNSTVQMTFGLATAAI
jgi:hypothetical protein